MKWDEMTEDFQTGAIFRVKDTRLNEYLAWLSIMGDYQTIRCLIINTIKTDRYIKKVNRRNVILTVIIIVLSVLAISVTIWSEWRARETAQQIQELVELQKREVQLLTEARKSNDENDRNEVPWT